MKSIMEEASTITKAIENAWNRASQPQEFTVKILELPKTSFFGLKTSKSAKIALIFSETAVRVKEQSPKPIRPLPQRQERKESNQQRQEASSDKQLHRRPLQSREQQKDQRHHEARPDKHEQRRPQGPQQCQPYRQSSDEQRRHSHENWTPEMVEMAHDWAKETLVLMGKPEIRVAPHVSQNYLKLRFDQPIMEDQKQEETQLKSWGNLAMEAIREKTNKPLRNLRIILESNSSRRS